MIVEASRAKGIPHAYLAFAGEDHGFRAETSPLDRGELSFFGQVFGFEPADAIERLELTSAR